MNISKTYELCRRLMLNAHVEWLHILSIDTVHVNASCKRQWLNVMVNLSHMLMQVEINPAEVIISGINKQTNEPTTSIINHTISWCVCICANASGLMRMIDYTLRNSRAAKASITCRIHSSLYSRKPGPVTISPNGTSTANSPSAVNEWLQLKGWVEQLAGWCTNIWHLTTSGHRPSPSNKNNKKLLLWPSDGQTLRHAMM